MTLRVYVDSSALIKRAVEEPESEALEAALEDFVSQDASLITSSLAWIEVSRAIRVLVDENRISVDEGREAFEVALSGVGERPISDDVVSLARRIGPPRLRTLDAIHLSSAVLVDAHAVIAYDGRLGEACRLSDLAVLAPGPSQEPPV